MRQGSELAAGIILLGLFAVDATMVMLGVTQQYDAQAGLLMNRSFGGTFTALMIVMTDYGREYFWTIVVSVLLIFGDHDAKVFAVELVGLFLIGAGAGEVLTHVLYRPRPFERVGGIVPRITPGTDSAFPSGHALIVAIGAVASVLRLKRRRRRRLPMLLVLEAAVVCYSRVYLGVSYPLDVVGGALLGGAVAFLGVLVLERPLRRYVVTLVSVIERSMRPPLSAHPS